MNMAVCLFSQPKEHSGTAVLVLRSGEAGSDKEASYLVNGDRTRIGVIGQALRQPMCRLVKLPSPEGYLRQIGTVARQEFLIFQLETETQTLVQQPARL